MDDRLNWFLDRVGKIVYRNNTSCKCKTCQYVYENGLVISDDFHARYLRDIEAEFTAAGHPTQYFDSRQEALRFEKQ